MAWWWDWQLDLIVSLQTIHNPVLDSLFRGITFMGEAEFLLLLLPLITWTVDKTLGYRLAYLIFISIALNTWAKAIFNHPRPFEWPTPTDSPVLKLDSRARGPGLPSGHAQSSLVLWFFLAYHFKRPWFWAVAVLLFGLVSFSRVYLGVHFPTDLVGGAMLGLVVLVLFVWVEPTLTGQISTWPVWQQVALGAGLPLLLILAYPHPDAIATLGAVGGLSLGIIFERQKVKFEITGSVVRRAIRFGVGLSLMAIVFFGLRFIISSGEGAGYVLANISRYGLAGFWAGGGAFWFFKRVGLA